MSETLILNAARRGRKHSLETRAKISAANRGRKLSPETCAKISAAQMDNKKCLGYKHTPETRTNMSTAMKGNKHAWKGGRTIGGAGYVLISSPTHPHKDCKDYVYEHRLVMEAHMGRPLLPTEVVHHGPGGKSDNRIENLTRFDSQSDHASWHYQNEKEK